MTFRDSGGFEWRKDQIILGDFCGMNSNYIERRFSLRKADLFLRKYVSNFVPLLDLNREKPLSQPLLIYHSLAG